MVVHYFFFQCFNLLFQLSDLFSLIFAFFCKAVQILCRERFFRFDVFNVIGAETNGCECISNNLNRCLKVFVRNCSLCYVCKGGITEISQVLNTGLNRWTDGCSNAGGIKNSKEAASTVPLVNVPVLNDI